MITLISARYTKLSKLLDGEASKTSYIIKERSGDNEILLRMEEKEKKTAVEYLDQQYDDVGIIRNI